MLFPQELNYLLDSHKQCLRGYSLTLQYLFPFLSSAWMGLNPGSQMMGKSPPTKLCSWLFLLFKSESHQVLKLALTLLSNWDDQPLPLGPADSPDASHSDYEGKAQQRASAIV